MAREDVGEVMQNKSRMGKAKVKRNFVRNILAVKADHMTSQKHHSVV